MHRLTLLVSFLVFTAGGAWAADFELLNTSETPIRQMYIAPTGGPDWGPDQLDDGLFDGMVEPGGSVIVENVEPGAYDVMIVDETGTECMLDAVDFSDIPVIEITEADLAACDVAAAR